MAPRRSSRSTRRPNRFQAPASPAVSDDVEHSQDLLPPGNTTEDVDAEDEVSPPASGEGSNEGDGKSCDGSEEGVVVRRRRTKKAGRGCHITLGEYNDRIGVMEQRINILKAEVRFFCRCFCFPQFANTFAPAQTTPIESGTRR